MQTVYVMNENEKAMTGGLLLIALVIGGLYWGFTTLFPSEESRLSSAQSLQSQVERDVQAIEREVSSLERIVEGPKESVDLGHTGSTLHSLKENVASSEAACKKIGKHVDKLAKSQNVDMQLQAAGLAKESKAAREKLPALEKRAADVEQKLKKLLE